MKTNQKQCYRLLAGGLLGIAVSVLNAPAMAQTTPAPNAPAAGTTTTAATNATTATTTAKSTPAPLPTIDAAPGTPEEIAQLRDLVNALTTRLQTLETDQKKTADAVSKSPVNVSTASKLPITVSGLFQIRGDAFRGQDGPGAESFDTFRLRRAELRITAPAITSRISGTVMLDLAKSISLASGNTSINQSGRVLQELQISYLLRKAAAAASGAPRAAGAGNTPAPLNNIYIDAGQFKIPVGYEGDQVSSGSLLTVERALMFGARDPFGGGFGDVRDTGVQLRGTQGQFRYWLGAFNGLGERQNDNSSSDTKAIIGRLAFNPRSVPGLTVGISGARGNNRNSGTAGQAADRNLLNAYAAYTRNKLTLQGEYLTGDSQRLPLNTTGFDNDVRGYYGLIGYRFTPKIEGVFRYDYFNFDRQLDDAAVRDLVLGVNYYIKGNNAKIQANIVRRSGGEAIVSGNGFSSSLSNQFSNDRTELRVQGQVAF